LRIFAAIVMSLILVASALAGQVFYQNFDSQNYTGLSCWYGTSQTACVAGKYGWDTGYGGTGYAFKKSDSLDPDARLGYYPGDTWSSDVMYFFARFKFTEFTDTFAIDGTINNYKLLYIHFEGTSSYLAPATIYSSPSSMYYSSMDSGTALSTCDTGFSSVYKSFGTNIADGNWHTIETYIKFSTGEVKQWIDGSLRINDNYDFNCSNGWVNTLHDITFPDQDAGTGTYATNPDTTMLVDDWVLWDSAPANIGSGNFPSGTTGDTTPPYVYSTNPADQDTGVSSSSNVTFTIKDAAGNLSTSHSNLYWTIAGSSSGSSGTLYSDSSDVSCSGDSYTLTCTKSSNTFTAGETVTLTIDANDSIPNSMAQEVITFDIAESGAPSTPTCSSYSNGDVITGSQTVTLNWTGATNATGYSWTCPLCSTTSGSGSVSSGAFSFNVTLPTNGYGEELLINSGFDTDASWNYDNPPWTNTGSAFTQSNYSSAYGIWQGVSVSMYETLYGCLTPASGSNGTLYVSSQYGLSGEGNSILLSYTAGSQACDDFLVLAPGADHRIVANCTPDKTMTLNSASLKRKGAFATINVTASNGSGDANTVLYLTHFTSSQGTDSQLISNYPENGGTEVPSTATIIATVANTVETIAENSIALSLNGTSYDCTDDELSCSSCSGYTSCWEIILTPPSALSKSRTLYTVTLDADYLDQEVWTFTTESVAASINNSIISNGAIYN